MKVTDEDIERALVRSEGNRVRAALDLKIGLRTLRYKIHRSPILSKKYQVIVDDSVLVKEEDLPEDVRGRFRDYFAEVVMQKPGYHFANDKKRVKIHEQVLQEFIAGKVRDHEHFQESVREDS
jgi:hypothetical protein